MREFSAMRPALRDPDAIGAFANAIFVQPGGTLDCGRKIGRRNLGGFLLDFTLLLGFLTRLLLGVLAMRSPLVRLAPSVP
jgi:hypothetical protein